MKRGGLWPPRNMVLLLLRLCLLFLRGFVVALLQRLIHDFDLLVSLCLLDEGNVLVTHDKLTNLRLDLLESRRRCDALVCGRHLAGERSAGRQWQ